MDKAFTEVILEHFPTARRLRAPLLRQMLKSVFRLALLHIIRIEELHSAARKVILSHSPHNGGSLSHLSFCNVLICRAFQNWHATIKYWMMMRNFMVDAGDASDEDPEADTRLSAFALFKRHRFAEMKRDMLGGHVVHCC